jgi:hypothetical protein
VRLSTATAARARDDPRGDRIHRRDAAGRGDDTRPWRERLQRRDPRHGTRCPGRDHLDRRAGCDDGRSSCRPVGAHDRSAFIPRSLRVGVLRSKGASPEDDPSGHRARHRALDPEHIRPRPTPGPGSSPKWSQAPES